MIVVKEKKKKFQLHVVGGKVFVRDTLKFHYEQQNILPMCKACVLVQIDLINTLIC